MKIVLHLYSFRNLTLEKKAFQMVSTDSSSTIISSGLIHLFTAYSFIVWASLFGKSFSAQSDHLPLMIIFWISSDFASSRALSTLLFGIGHGFHSSIIHPQSTIMNFFSCILYEFFLNEFDEIVHVLEIMVDRSESYISHIIDIFEFVEHVFSDSLWCDSFLVGRPFVL